jgi:hypothetical protein
MTKPPTRGRAFPGRSKQPSSYQFAFGQEKQAALEIDVLPLQVKNFPKAATREEQEPERCVLAPL